MKFVEKKSEYIVKGIFINGLIVIIISSVKALRSGTTINIESMNAFRILIGIFIVSNVIRCVSGILLLKFLCDALFKLLKGSDSLLKE